MSQRPLRIFTAVWGQQHLEWFENGLVRSLGWPQNKASIQHAVWSIFAMPSDMDRAKEIASRILPADKIETHNLISLLQGSLPTAQSFLFRALMSAMHECLGDGSQFLMAPPDTVFSEGSIQTLIEVGHPQGTCVAVAHPRVHPSLLTEINDKEPLAGGHMCRLSFLQENLHRTWVDAEVGREMVNSYIAGVSWRRINPSIIAVSHRLPTVYLANFTAADLTYFMHPKRGRPQSFGYWDHDWPSELTNHGRQRVIGSSDAAFVVEITKPQDNIPPVRHANEFDPTAFCRQESHNLHNLNALVIFRPE